MPAILRVILLVSLAAGLVGCDPVNATVSGTVTWEGAPLERGYINFMPVDGDTSPEGGPVTDGKFHVTDIPPGKKTVEIIGVKKTAFASSSDDMRRAAESGGKSAAEDAADIIPPDAEGNRRVVEVKVGSQTMEFVLQKAK